MACLVSIMNLYQFDLLSLDGFIWRRHVLFDGLCMYSRSPIVDQTIKQAHNCEIRGKLNLESELVNSDLKSHIPYIRTLHLQYIHYLFPSSLFNWFSSSFLCAFLRLSISNICGHMMHSNTLTAHLYGKTKTTKIVQSGMKRLFTNCNIPKSFQRRINVQSTVWTLLIQ